MVDDKDEVERDGVGRGREGYLEVRSCSERLAEEEMWLVRGYDDRRELEEDEDWREEG